MYERTYWQDHVTQPGNCYRIANNNDGTHTITPAGRVMQQGTPQDQTHFNRIEGGIFDAHLATLLLLAGIRQNAWEMEQGEIALTNSGIYPFNNSEKSVSLKRGRENGEYIVLAEVKTATGNVGEVVVSGKLTNGFKLAYTGSAKNATIKYTVIGGYLK